jgi:hypothetical protein
MKPHLYRFKSQKNKNGLVLKKTNVVIIYVLQQLKINKSLLYLLRFLAIVWFVKAK